MNVRTDIPNDRRQELEEFAAGSAQPHLPSAPTIAPMVSPVDRVFGAQKVAVYRDDARVLQKLSALGAAAGDDWFYRFPVKNRRENRTDWIEGASIKLANDVARIYGNCDVDTRVFDAGDHWVIYARFTDFESGFSLTRPFQQRKSGGKIGGEGNDGDARRLDIAFQIGVSKAIRNVVVNALQTYADYAFDAARNSLVDKIGKDLEAWRNRVVEGLGKIPVEVKRAELVIGKPAKEWLAPDVAKIIAMMKAIADGMASADDSFPLPDKQVEGQAQPQTTGESTSQQQASSEASAPAATGQPASGTTQAASSPDTGKPSPEAGKATETKADATTTTTATTAKADTKAPANEAEYVTYAKAMSAAATDADELDKWWKGDKQLRNKVNVSGEVRDDLEETKNTKAAELRKAAKK